jgi:hypothetical protein
VADRSVTAGSVAEQNASATPAVDGAIKLEVSYEFSRELLLRTVLIWPGRRGGVRQYERVRWKLRCARNSFRWWLLNANGHKMI